MMAVENLRADQDNKDPAVILDVDGVLNSYSNAKFYFQFIFKSLRHLAKLKGRKTLLKQLPKLKKYGGPNALFAFAKDFCGNDETFNTYKNNLINSLNFNLIKHDPSLKAMMKNLSRYGRICIRSDGLADISYAVWRRVIGNQKSSTIKYELKTTKNNHPYRHLSFNGKNILISGIEDNNFKTKTNVASWHDFSDKHNVNIAKSVLIDDSRANLKTAKMLNMTTVHISKLDSFLQDSSFGTVYQHSLSDILGCRLSSTLKKLRISYGKKVDLKKLFHALLHNKNPKEQTSPIMSQAYQMQRD